MQVTTSNQHEPARHEPAGTQGSKYAGNHFQQARTTRTHKAHQSAGTSFAGPEKVTSKAQSKHQPARHKVQGVQVITSNQHEPARHKDTRTSRHKVQGMQVTTPKKQPQR